MRTGSFSALQRGCEAGARGRRAVRQGRGKVGQDSASASSYAMYSGFNQLRTADHGTGWSRNNVRRISIWASLGSSLRNGLARRTGHHALLAMPGLHDTVAAGRAVPHDGIARRWLGVQLGQRCGGLARQVLRPPMQGPKQGEAASQARSVRPGRRHLRDARTATTLAASVAIPPVRTPPPRPLTAPPGQRGSQSPHEKHQATTGHSNAPKADLHPGCCVLHAQSLLLRLSSRACAGTGVSTASERPWERRGCVPSPSAVAASPPPRRAAADDVIGRATFALRDDGTYGGTAGPP